MPTSLFQYEMLPTTWFYLSSLLIIAVFFRFNRLFSVRNFDVLLLIFLTPGLAYIAMGATLQGYLCLAGVGALIFCRLALDVFLRRRPLLEPNLNAAGLTFACVASTAFMIPNLFINRGDACESSRAWRLEQILTCAADADENGSKIEDWPGYRPFLEATRRTNRFFAPSAASWERAISERNAESGAERTVDFFGLSIRSNDDEGDDERRSERAARSFRAMEWASGRGAANEFESDFLLGTARNAEIPSTAISASSLSGDESADGAESGAAQGFRVAPTNAGTETVSNGGESTNAAIFRALTSEEAALILAIVALQTGIVVSTILIGRIHFGSMQTGVAAALFYLLHPYVNQFSGCLDHIVPALLILLAVLFYRRPFIAGISIGSAGALVFYPFFLVPLWLSFYWKKGASRFAIGASAAALTFAVALLFATPESNGNYGAALAAAFGRHSMFLASADGLWEFLPRFYRIPLIALYGAFCVGFALWPPRKNLATLLSCSALLTLGVQFWIGYRGGLYMAWFLPLTVLTVFRPNLEDRTAATTVADL